MDSIFSSFTYCPHVSGWKRSPKTQFFKNALQSGQLWKRRLANDYVTVLDPAQLPVYAHASIN